MSVDVGSQFPLPCEWGEPEPCYFHCRHCLANNEVAELRAEIERHHRDFARWEDMADKGARQLQEIADLRAEVERLQRRVDGPPMSPETVAAYAFVEREMALQHGDLWGVLTVPPGTGPNTLCSFYDRGYLCEREQGHDGLHRAGVIEW